MTKLIPSGCAARVHPFPAFIGRVTLVISLLILRVHFSPPRSARVFNHTQIAFFAPQLLAHSHALVLRLNGARVQLVAQVFWDDFVSFTCPSIVFESFGSSGKPHGLSRPSGPLVRDGAIAHRRVAAFTLLDGQAARKKNLHDFQNLHSFPVGTCGERRKVDALLAASVMVFRPHIGAF